MKTKGYLWTGQTTCHDTYGHEIPCSGSGQDADFRKGLLWPAPRFQEQGDIVLDFLTGLFWTKDANIFEFPLSWNEALDQIAEMNIKNTFGFDDWRIPNRRELRSLMSHQTKNPALPEDHPFKNVFLSWYWTSSSAAINPAFAWYIHMEGARMFYGSKMQHYLFWPVRGKGNGVIPATGQAHCYDSKGCMIPSEGTCQDGEFCFGHAWPEKRFEVIDDLVIDYLTDLCWLRTADLTDKHVTWDEAFEVIIKLNSKMGINSLWRLPNINELESLVDISTHSPALPSGHPFKKVQEAYWSSTTSMFEPDWAWALYCTKGAIGVGQKWGAHFHVWAVCDVDDLKNSEEYKKEKLTHETSKGKEYACRWKMI